MIEEPNANPQSTDLPTRWALAVGGTGDARKEALRDLAASYWYCVYAWWRRAGLEAANAATATIASFTRWLGDFPPDASDSAAARMREWLPARLAELAEQGVELEGAGALVIDAEWAEQRYATEPAGEPDPIFQRVWALTLLEFTVSTLRTEYAGRGEEPLFAELLTFAGFESGDEDRYAAAGERAGRSGGAMRKAVFDFRTRQREVLRAIATDTLRDPADTDSELTVLLCSIDAPGIDATPLPSAIGGLKPEEALVRAMQSVRMTGMGRGTWKTPSDSEVTRLFPQYEILGLIGRGGMGAVYKGRQRELDRVVAIKLLPLEVSVDRDFAERFRREARAMAKLSHPHIITVFDFGTTSEGHLFFVMEFVEGANLHDMIRKVGIEPAQALAISAQVCTALAYAHDKGIVHRDIKPANVMVDLDGQAKVADFGLARLTEIGVGHSGFTVTGAVLGTPDYMAPEQKHGTRVDHRADIYSVGVMLYEMLCRETPQGAFDPPSKRVGCDTRIDTIVLKAMQQAPDHRYQTTVEMRAAVASALSPAHPTPPRRFGPAPAPPKVEPPRKGLPLFPVAFVLVLGVVGYFLYENSKGPREIAAVPENTRPTSPAAPTPPKVEESKSVPSKDNGSPAPNTGGASVVVTAPATPAPLETPAPASMSATAKWLAEQVPQWQTAYAAEVSVPFMSSVGSLKKQYLAALEKQLAALAKAAKLDDAVAFRAERDRMTGGGEVPAEDDPAVPAALKTLRASYRTSFTKLDTERFAKAKTVHARYDAILAQSQTALTQRQRLDEALEMKAQREALSAAWLTPPGGAALKAPAVVAFSPSKAEVAEQTVRAPLPAAILKDGFTNTLGMKLVPVRGTDVLFCVHETRRQDYAAFAAEVAGMDGSWKNRQRDGIPIGGENIHPVVAVSWDDAQAFCAWLSQREGKTYRLPTDEEWSIAVGLGQKERRGKDTTPEMLNGKENTEFPWDGSLPLKTKDRPGNYTDSAYHEKFPVDRWYEGFTDGFPTTAPVMSFKPNKQGLYDMGGNVREWVDDWWNAAQLERAVRGSDWNTSGPSANSSLYLTSSYRGHSSAGARSPTVGFRVVLENRFPAKPAASIAKAGATPAPVVATANAPVVNPFGPWQPLFTDAEWKETVLGRRELVDGRVHLRGALTVLKPQPAADGAIRARIQFQQGSKYVAFQARRTGSEYFKAELSSSSHVALNYFLPGSAKPDAILGTHTLPKPLQPGDTVLLELRLQGDRLTVFVDGTVAIEARDSRLPGPGQWGITANDGWFESVEVQAAPSSAPSASGAAVPKPVTVPGYAQPWQAPLRAAGVESKSFGKLPDGTWVVDLDYATIRDLKPLSGVPLSRLHAGYTEVADLGPVRGMPLKELWIPETKVTDLTPLKGMPLEILSLKGTSVTDLSVLRGMPLTTLKLHDCAALTDLAPLADLKALTDLTLPPNGKDIEFLRTFPKLEHLSYTADRQNGDRAKQTVAEFWSKDHTQGWLRTLHATGVVIKAAKQLPDGTWDVDLRETQFSDLTLLKGAPISRLTLFKTAVTDLSPLRGLALTYLDARDTKVADLSPLQGMPLQRLLVGGTPITDLSPVRGMALVDIEVRDTKVTDFSPLTGMPLQSLNLGQTAIKDLEPFRGMPITRLWIYNTKFADLSPLAGMPIRNLNMFGSKAKDISVLRGMPLTELRMHNCPELTDLSPLAESKELAFVTLPWNAKGIDFLRAFPKLTRIDFSETPDRPVRPAAEFWQEYDTQGWLRTLRDSGFGPRGVRQLSDGTWELSFQGMKISDLTTLKGVPISNLNLTDTAVSDLTPLRGMPLNTLRLFKTKVSDLSPLQGMALRTLSLSTTKVTDLSVLRGMPLTYLKLHDCPALTDLSPLADCKELMNLTVPSSAHDLEFLRTFPKLERLSFKEDSSANGYRPLQTAAEFWKEYDAQKK